MNAAFLMQVHREALIKDACHYITYTNHGQELPVCTELLANPSLDAGRLTSYKGFTTEDMCKGDGYETKKVLIPARMNRGKAIRNI